MVSVVGEAAVSAAAEDPSDDSAHLRAAGLAALIIDLQATGLRVEVPLERRTGGAGPSDSGMLWVGGFPVTVPTDNALARTSPFVLKAEDEGYAIYRDGVRLADAST
jgi:hypothetical protein